jgi:hypothetical protein
LAGEVLLSPPSELSGDLLMGAGWVINLAVAERVIRKQPGRMPSGRARTASGGVSHLH